MQLTPRICMEILAHEALVTQAYKDSVGVWTWSVGITSASGHSVERYIGKPQSIERCLAVWLWVLERYRDEVTQAFSKPLTEEQFGAALSFHYNTGAIKRAAWVKSWNRGDKARARREIMNWVKPAVLRKRRERERALFFDGEWTSKDWMANVYTRVNRDGTPDRRSVKRVDIQDDLLAALAGHSPGAPPDIPAEPLPPAPPVIKEPVGWVGVGGALMALAIIFWDKFSGFFRGLM